jgi:Flp pilus assembly pilin Flp
MLIFLALVVSSFGGQPRHRVSWLPALPSKRESNEEVVMTHAANRGATLTEYILIVLFIAVAALVGMSVLGNGVNSMFKETGDAAEAASTSISNATTTGNSGASAKVMGVLDGTKLK